MFVVTERHSASVRLESKRDGSSRYDGDGRCGVHSAPRSIGRSNDGTSRLQTPSPSVNRIKRGNRYDSGVRCAPEIIVRRWSGLAASPALAGDGNRCGADLDGGGVWNCQFQFENCRTDGGRPAGRHQYDCREYQCGAPAEEGNFHDGDACLFSNALNQVASESYKNDGRSHHKSINRLSGSAFARQPVRVASVPLCGDIACPPPKRNGRHATGWHARKECEHFGAGQ